MVDWMKNLAEIRELKEKQIQAEKRQKELENLKKESKLQKEKINRGLLRAKDCKETLSLLKKGADPNADVNATRPLLWANTVEQAELLLKWGADVNFVTSEGDNFITSYAKYNNANDDSMLKIIDLAVKNGIKKDILNQSLNGVYTEEAFLALIRNGADVQKFDWDKSIDKYLIFRGIKTYDKKVHGYQNRTNISKANQQEKIMKAAIKEGYDFKNNSKVLNNTYLKEIIEELIQEERYKSFTESEKKLLKELELGNRQSLRVYLQKYGKFEPHIEKYMNVCMKEKDFVQYYNALMSVNKGDFMGGEAFFIDRAVWHISHLKPRAYEGAEAILKETNYDCAVCEKFLNAAAKIALEHKGTGMRFMLDTYRKCPEQDRSRLLNILISMRTSGKLAERRKTATLFKEVNNKTENKETLPEINSLSKVSYTPFSALNKLMRDQKQQ